MLFEAPFLGEDAVGWFLILLTGQKHHHAAAGLA